MEECSHRYTLRGHGDQNSAWASTSLKEGNKTEQETARKTASCSQRVHPARSCAGHWDTVLLWDSAQGRLAGLGVGCMEKQQKGRGIE